MRILISDDDIVSSRFLQAGLVKWGYDVIATRDGEQAWQEFQGQDPPQLAILDWMMPRLDGVSLCQKVRGASKLRNVYLIILTGRNQPEEIIAGLRAGANDYITKPYSADELQARVEAGLRIVETQMELAARERDFVQREVLLATSKSGTLLLRRDQGEMAVL